MPRKETFLVNGEKSTTPFKCFACKKGVHGFERHNGAMSHASRFTLFKNVNICSKPKCVHVVTVLAPGEKHQCVNLVEVSDEDGVVYRGYDTRV